MVVDTSVLLTVFFGEPAAAWAAAQLSTHEPDLRMSTVNLTEALIRIRDRQPNLADELEERIMTSSIRFIPPDVRQARFAAAARLRFPLRVRPCVRQ